MKNVLEKNSKLFFITLAFLIVMSCKKHNTEKIITLNDGEKIVDTTKGIFIKYPFIESIGYLEEKKQDEIIQITLEKKTTKDSLDYFLKVRSYKKGWSFWNSKLIICRYVQDYSPILDNKLDLEIEKKFYKTPKKAFVVKLEYGTSHITWNYLFEIDDLNKKLYLKDIFYIEKYQNLGQIPQDTLFYLAKIKINKDTNNLPVQKIDSLFNCLEKVKNKTEKWIIK